MSFDLKKYLAEGKLLREESIPPRKFKVGDTVEFTPEAFEDYYRKKNMKGYIRDSPYNTDEEYIKERYIKNGYHDYAVIDLNHRGHMVDPMFIPEENLQFRKRKV